MAQRLFVSVLEGTSPHDARPVFASGDPRVVEAVMAVLRTIVTPQAEAPSVERVLELNRKTDR